MADHLPRDLSPAGGRPAGFIQFPQEAGDGLGKGIGEDLPTDPFAQAIPGLLRKLDEAGWPAAAEAIMTTDTVPKLSSRRIQVGGREVTVTHLDPATGQLGHGVGGHDGLGDDDLGSRKAAAVVCWPVL